jgi:hypothetical protein
VDDFGRCGDLRWWYEPIWGVVLVKGRRDIGEDGMREGWWLMMVPSTVVVIKSV